MKIRIREHEFILVIVVALFGVGVYLIQFFMLSAEDIEAIYEESFISNGNSFNYYLNILILQLAQIVMPFLCYLWIYKRLTPLFGNVNTELSLHSKYKKISWIILQFILIGVLLMVVGMVTTYYAHPRTLEESILRIKAIDIVSIQMSKKLIVPHLFFPSYDIGGNSLGQLYIIYFLYFVIREAYIYLLNRFVKRKSYIALISNQATTFLVPYILLCAIMLILRKHGFPSIGLNIILSTFIIFMVNVYWVFPLKGDAPFLSSRFIGSLLLSTLVATLPIYIYNVIVFHSAPSETVFVSWLLLTFIISPLTWMIYQQRKDKILELRGVQKVLEKSNADLQFLKSQINPHFLFNALNTLYGTALMEKSKYTAVGIQTLGDMMRFMLHENNQDYILLSREIDYLENYISLQKLRIQESSKIVIEESFDVQCSNQHIAPMMLIPFVENAFKHGISLRKESWVNIKLTCGDDEVYFEVKNSIHSSKEGDTERDESGIGLQNVKERLKLLYFNKHDLSIRDEGGEYIAKLSLKL